MSDPLAAKLAELSQRFRLRAADEHRAIAGALADGDRATIAERAHKLAGNAGMFGHPEITEAALELENAAESDADMSAPAKRLLGLLAAL